MVHIAMTVMKNMTKTKTKTSKSLETIVNFILDKSGSMENVRKETIQGFNKYLKELKSLKGKVSFSFTLFNTSFTKRYIMTPVKEIPLLNAETYVPNGMTALYDAAVETIEEVSDQVDKMEIKPAVLTVIMTDGEENSSCKHDQSCLTDLIKKLKDQGNYTFIFMGSNQDAWATAKVWGLDQGNVLSYNANGMGSTNAFRNLSRGTQVYMSAMSAQMSTNGNVGNVTDFFKANDSPTSSNS